MAQTQSHSSGLKAHESLEDTFYTPDHQVACDGGNGALGHPRVFLEVADNGEVICPYCSRTFVYQA